MKIEIIPTELALSIILKKNSNFDYIKNLIIDAEEVEMSYDNFFISYLNGNDLSANVYTDISKGSKLKWIWAHENDIPLGFQLAYFGDHQIEFICIEKNNSLLYDIDLFSHIVSYVNSISDKPIITFPLNDKLKSYYLKHGFVEYEKDYLIKM